MNTVNATQVYKYVWLVNDMDTDFDKEVTGNKYFIPKKGKIKLRRHEAAQVIGYFPGKEVLHQFHTEPIYEDVEQKFVSQIDGKTFKTQKELDEHVTKLREKLVKG